MLQLCCQYVQQVTFPELKNSYPVSNTLSGKTNAFPAYWRKASIFTPTCLNRSFE